MTAPDNNKKLSPSQFMRKLRPEYYSDTEDRALYVLDVPTLEYHLDTLTQRNQTHNFEIFCRKLCERTICPNLRPQTGPEGGGDSKADTETYPFADEIATLTYVGRPNIGSERWAFAFSAKEKWAQKVRSDVEGLIETGRPYDRIFFVTSRFARAKDRARIEDELSTQFGIPVTIHDRSWIVTEVIEKDRKDIAYNYLGIGKQTSDPLHLGPTDYSRARQLADIEKSIDDPDAYIGIERQRVTEALVAAKLSRGLEKPRTETDGRFLRAIRLADADGSYRQKLETRYEQIWTAFWWFDDIPLVNEAYTAFEKLALPANHTKDLEFLGNLNQALVNIVVHHLLSREECRYDERTANLKRALEVMAADTERPNNSLEAKTSLLILRLNDAALEKRRDDLPDIWRGFGEVLDEARGLGEFDADQLAKMIELGGNVAGNDPAYTALIEKLADFVADRAGEAEGALILLKRAQKLDFSDNLEMIRLLGRAAHGLSKKEYSSSLIEAVRQLMIAYRSAGMLWAARASCIFTAASIAIEGEENSQLPVEIIPVLKIWAWIALQMHYLPDMLQAIQVLNGAMIALPLTEDSKAKIKEDVSELDQAFASILMNFSDDELRKLETLPDLLEGLGLFIARTALLYTLGYNEILRADGSLPSEESDEDVNRMLSVLASQPVAKQSRGPLIVNDDGDGTFTTSILGMNIEIHFNGTNESIVVAEAVLASLEAFFSTALDQSVVPHTERFEITIVENQGVSIPAFAVDQMEMTAELSWPVGLSPSSFERRNDVLEFLAMVCGQVLGATCISKEPEALLEKLFRDEAVQQRMALVAVAAASHQRFASHSVNRLTDWGDCVRRSYELRSERPTMNRINLPGAAEAEDDPKQPQSHSHRYVRSVIHVHAWNVAHWKGVAYAELGPQLPPAMILLFQDGYAAVKIFERWRERFGDRDESDEIRLTIIRQLPSKNPNHYLVVVASQVPDLGDRYQDLAIATRSMTMTPNDSANLERFLTSYHRSGSYVLAPGVWRSGQPPDLMLELGLLKRALNLKLAVNVGEEDVEAIAVRMREP